MHFLDQQRKKIMMDMMDEEDKRLLDLINAHLADDRNTEKSRRCLRCQHEFTSKHAGNRICPACSKEPPSAHRMFTCDFDSVAGSSAEYEYD